VTSPPCGPSWMAGQAMGGLLMCVRVLFLLLFKFLNLLDTKNSKKTLKKI
jgi:hypothetical protein